MKTLDLFQDLNDLSGAVIVERASERSDEAVKVTLGKIAVKGLLQSRVREEEDVKKAYALAVKIHNSEGSGAIEYTDDEVAVIKQVFVNQPVIIRAQLIGLIED